MYMPGRFRTGSRPSRTVMSFAVYVLAIVSGSSVATRGGRARRDRELPTPNLQLPRHSQPPTPKGPMGLRQGWELGVGSALEVGSWRLGVDSVGADRRTRQEPACRPALTVESDRIPTLLDEQH